MEYWSKKKFQTVILWSVFCVSEFQACCLVANQLKNETGMPAQSPLPSPSSSYYFLVEGDTYEAGLFHAIVHVGDPLNEFFLDIDTCSDLTWITCSPSNVKLLKSIPDWGVNVQNGQGMIVENSSTGPLTEPMRPARDRLVLSPNGRLFCTAKSISLYGTPHDPYTTNNNLASCEDDTICGLVNKPVDPQCSTQYQQCDYQIEYADHSSSLGVLVKDSFLLSSSLHAHPSYSTSTLTFGCGYHQEFPFDPPFADGVLGLGDGKTSFLSQLNDQGLIKKVLALCLSEFGPGYLVLGDSQSDTQGIIWMPISNDYVEPKNMLGPTDLVYDGTNTLASGLLFLFDSGATYNYFSPKTYGAVLSWLTELAENVATPTDDSYLPVCWTPMTSSNDVLNYFSSLRFRFIDNENVYFELESDDYLVVSPHGNVCLGILNGQELGPELDNLNIIGDIAMLDKLMIFDYENQKIGSVSRDCMQLPKQLSLRETGPAKHRSGKKRKAHRHKKMNQKKRKQEPLSGPGN